MESAAPRSLAGDVAELLDLVNEARGRLDAPPAAACGQPVPGDTLNISRGPKVTTTAVRGLVEYAAKSGRCGARRSPGRTSPLATICIHVFVQCCLDFHKKPSCIRL